nr:unnamed protein product [Callosobruchus analis]
MESRATKPLGISIFKRYFKRDYNIGIHVPRKDKCIHCERFKNIPDNKKTDEDRNNYSIHQKDKNDAKELFLAEQSRSSDNGFIVVSFDLQKVLGTPQGPSMTFGFSRKYAVYNFTIYESKTQNGYCYIWGEKDGKRGVNEICTNLYSYLTQLDKAGNYQAVSLFCDNCPGQNKNKFILSMLMFFLKNSTSITEVTITYLVAGHTYMPVDSVHAVIERYARNMTVHAPSEWPTIIRNARKRPNPYEVFSIHFRDFLNWKLLSVPKKLRAANGIDIRVGDIKRAIISKDNLKCMRISTAYEPDCTFYEINWTIKNTEAIPPIYNKELPINKKKLDNLTNLCRTLAIKPQYHVEYLTLKASSNVPDELPETDIDDNINE